MYQPHEFAINNPPPPPPPHKSAAEQRTSLVSRVSAASSIATDESTSGVGSADTQQGQRRKLEGSFEDFDDLCIGLNEGSKCCFDK